MNSPRADTADVLYFYVDSEALVPVFTIGGIILLVLAAGGFLPWCFVRKSKNPK